MGKTTCAKHEILDKIEMPCVHAGIVKLLQFGLM